MTCVLPSSLMFTQASRKGNLPSCSGSVVNLMLAVEVGSELIDMVFVNHGRYRTVAVM